MPDEQRTYQPLIKWHLDRLAEIARRDRESMFRRLPHYRQFRRRVLSVALCQGGAMHYVHRKCGVNDLDVWTLYVAFPGLSFNDRRRAREQFGPSDLVGWSERVDLLVRSLPYPIGSDPAAVWRDWLGKGSASLHCRHNGDPIRTNELLAQKAVVLLEPIERRGEIVWDPEVEGAA